MTAKTAATDGSFALLRKMVNFINMRIEDDRQGSDMRPFERLHRGSYLIGISEIRLADLHGSHGFLLSKNGRTIVYLDESHSFRKRNFSLAHEIGHLALQQIRGQKMSPTLMREVMSLTDDEEEKLCDLFASEMLMPRPKFLQLLCSYPICIEALANLAAVFQVSIEAAARRIPEVLDEGCITLIWKRSETGVPFIEGWHGSAGLKVFPSRVQSDMTSLVISDIFETGNTICTQAPLTLGASLRGVFYFQSAGFGSQSRYVVSLVFPWR